MDRVGFNFNIWLKMPRVNTLTSVSPNLVISGDGEFYSFSANTTSVNEGNTALFTVSTRNVSETTLYWTIVAVSGDLNSLDVNSLSGSFSLTSNVGTFPITLTEDSSTEGTEIFQVQLRKNSISGTIVANSSFIIANDTSLSPSYTLTANTTSVNEGSTVSFTVDTQNVNDGTVLYWTTLGVSGIINASDFSGSQIEGTVTINSNAASFIRTLSNDVTTEGTESFRIQLRRTSNTGTIVANSAVVTISDTSLTPPVTGQVLFAPTSSFPKTSGTSEYGYTNSGTWTVPSGVTRISVVCIGGGGGGSNSGTFTNPSGGGGGGLSYRNNFTVTPGETLYFTHGAGGQGATLVGSCATLWRGSPFQAGSTLICGAYGGYGRSAEGDDGIPNAIGGNGGARLTHNSSIPASPNIVSGSGAVSGSDGGGQGGRGGTATGNTRAAGGGGAAGYAGTGGNGGSSGDGLNGAGGGGGGGGSGTSSAGGGGGTLPTGQSSNGTGGTGGTTGGNGGGGTTIYNFAQRGRAYGGGGGGIVGSYSNTFQNGVGEMGCLRIIWPGDTRQFPSTRTADE